MKKKHSLCPERDSIRRIIFALTEQKKRCEYISDLKVYWRIYRILQYTQISNFIAMCIIALGTQSLSHTDYSFNMGFYFPPICLDNSE
jgi:hypothetical protein